MELASIYFQEVSDFAELVSAFPNIQNITCSYIAINPSLEAAPHGSETKKRDRVMQITNLHVTATVDVRAVLFLLDSSRTTVDSLSFTLQSRQPENEALFGELEASVRSLSQLSSLSFVIPCRGIIWDDDPGEDFLRNISLATRIIQSVSSVGAQDVRVDVYPEPVAGLGCRLFSGPRSLEVCAALEEALLSFPRPRVLVHDAVYAPGIRRLAFWSAQIERAFPTLDERGFLSFSFRDSQSNTPESAGHEAAVECLVASSDGRCLVTASWDGTIAFWNLESGTASQEWFAHRHGVRALALSPDSCRLVSTGRRDNTLAVWDISNGLHQAAVLEGHTRDVTSCAWSPNGALIGSASADGTVRVWDAQTFEQRDIFDSPWHVSFLRHLQFSPDSRFLAWASWPLMKRGCMIWKPMTGEQPKSLFSKSIRDEYVYVDSLSFDSESRRLVAAYAGLAHNDNIVRIWDTETGVLQAEMVGKEVPLMDVSFSPDGRSVMSASCDGSAKIWDAADGREMVSFDNRESSMQKAQFSSAGKARFSPDGKYAVTASWGGKVQLWRTEDGGLVAVFTKHCTAVVHVAFCSHGEYLASADFDGVVYITRLSTLL